MPEATDERTARALEMLELSESRLVELEARETHEAPSKELRESIVWELGFNAALRQLLGQDDREDEEQNDA